MSLIYMCVILDILQDEQRVDAKKNSLLFVIGLDKTLSENNITRTYMQSEIVFHQEILYLWFYCSQNFKLLGFLILRLPDERLFQKRAVQTKLDIYVLIIVQMFMSNLLRFCHNLYHILSKIGKAIHPGTL